MGCTASHGRPTDGAGRQKECKRSANILLVNDPYYLHEELVNDPMHRRPLNRQRKNDRRCSQDLGNCSVLESIRRAHKFNQRVYVWSQEAGEWLQAEVRSIQTNGDVKVEYAQAYKGCQVESTYSGGRTKVIPSSMVEHCISTIRTSRTY